jgi:molecular chaperone DnaK (HSP70)
MLVFKSHVAGSKGHFMFSSRPLNAHMGSYGHCSNILQIKDNYIKICFLARDDYRIKAEMLEKNLLEAQAKVEELQKMVDKALHLKDEVDILRETAEKAVKYEATIASYKKKLEDYGDLKREMKILEDKNEAYMLHNMELEEVCVSHFFVISE